MASGPGGLFKAVEVSTLGATKQSLSSEMSQVMSYLSYFFLIRFQIHFKLLDWVFSRFLKFHQMIKGINGSMILMINLSIISNLYQSDVGSRGHERERNKATTLGRVCEGPCLERLQGIWDFAVDGRVEVCRSYVICSVFTDFTVCFRVPLHLTFSSTMPQLHIMKS